MSGLSGLSGRAVGLPVTAPADSWGPWNPAITTAERVARLRAMTAIVRLSTGERGNALCDLLRQAETDPEALEPAAAALARLDALDYRRCLAAYANLHRPCPARRNRPC